MTDSDNRRLESIHVVAAIVWQPGDSGRFLVAKRPDGKHLANHWELPGGKREPGESRLQALSRELEEEVNITPLDARPFKRVNHQYEDRNILLDVWEVSAYEGEVVAMEAQAIRWIAIEDAGSYQFPDADLPILKAIKSSVTAKKERLP